MEAKSSRSSNRHNLRVRESGVARVAAHLKSASPTSLARDFFDRPIRPIRTIQASPFRTALREAARARSSKDDAMTQVLDPHFGNTNGRKHASRLRLLDLTRISAEDGVNRIIDRALELRASDIFIGTNEQHVAVHLRLRGQVEQLVVLDREQGKRYIARLRHQAGMDVSDYRKPHDGRWIYEGDNHHTVDLRINVVPTLHGDDMAIRLLDRDTDLLTLDRIGMSARQMDVYRPMLDHPGGMVLLTGPTGSGKTVTMYASLGYLNDGRRKIHTIEDPIEYAIDGLRQSAVNDAIELTAPELLRGVLRQAPDVVMVGEIRDAQTAQTATWAATT